MSMGAPIGRVIGARAPKRDVLSRAEPYPQPTRRVLRDSSRVEQRRRVVAERAARRRRREGEATLVRLVSVRMIEADLREFLHEEIALCPGLGAAKSGEREVANHW